MRSSLPGILAVAVAVFLAARPAAAQPVDLKRVQAGWEITGGAEDARWSLRYGTIANSRDWFKVQLIAAADGMAYFSHGQWLRLIDTKQGLVIGRWRFPCGIVDVAPSGGVARIQLKCTEPEAPSMPTLTFDPASPVLPDWPDGGLLLLRIPAAEAAQLVSDTPAGGLCSDRPLPVDRATAGLDDAEAAVRRDPASPFFRVALARYLKALSDSRAVAMFDAAADTGPADFNELFPLSACLELLGEPHAATRAYERAYRNYLERGYDPRLFSFLISRLFLYPFAWLPGIPAESRPDVVERIYRLTPGGEGAARSWEIFADSLDRQNRHDDARLWHARAAEARATSLVLTGDQLLPALDEAIAVLWAACAAGLLMVLALYVKYRPQRRLTLAIDVQKAQSIRRRGFLNIEYWSRHERLGFLTIGAVAWYASGLLVGYSHMLFVEAATPIGMTMGSYAAPSARSVLKDKFRASPARDLLLALSYQQHGDLHEAERLYRTLPDFAEAWNNLGVILQGAGKRDDAMQAYERALRLNPALVEAQLNVGRQPTSLWTDLHQRYLTGQPMVAVPAQSRMIDAVRGRGRAMFLVHALRGPFNGWAGPPLAELQSFGVLPRPRVLGVLFLSTFISGMCCVVATLWFFTRARDVTVAPGAAFRRLAAFIPGLSPSWGYFGAPALLTAMYVLLQIVLRWKAGTARIVTALAMTGVTRAYGLSGAWPLDRPYSPLLYGTAAALLIAHLLLIRRARR